MSPPGYLEISHLLGEPWPPPLLPLDGARDTERLRLTTARRESSGVEHHKQPQTGLWQARSPNVTPLGSRVCEWGRNERGVRQQSTFSNSIKRLISAECVDGPGLNAPFSCFVSIYCFCLTPLWLRRFSWQPSSSSSHHVELLKDSTGTTHHLVRYDCSPDHRHSCPDVPPRRAPLNLKTNTCWTVQSLFAYVDSVQGWRAWRAKSLICGHEE